MPKHSGDLGIGPEMIKKSGENYNLTTRKAKGIDSVILHHKHLPIQSLHMLQH